MKSLILTVVLCALFAIPLGAQGRIQPVWTEYPLIAMAAGIQGQVELTALVDKTGKIQRVQILSGQPILAKDAQTNLEKWIFATADAEQQVVVTYIYILDQRVTGKRMEFDGRTKTITIATARPPVAP
ncbi:MAG: hypothetical protein A2751_02960 [Candidatus Doudnabacteria bacterium RIFCSPHIGHO2_01_FULL_46_14]|uniref:TonB C-terminal domain-containing protein n=1 Tax=Candidatus Doudnabacteria bacterium RIFCSPHIGHO2_01_FULL_46_14 TaxID=1817824 RepID=A0A1F5NK76_9BACT|nr:MAG: hypothetical protein A2751_02960 [Candidatus Doudnabacteria bacterium RIFCSPHIGHO2_01_FULL_46_14]